MTDTNKMTKVAFKNGVPLPGPLATVTAEPIPWAEPELQVPKIIPHREFLWDVKTEFIDRYK